MKRIMPVIVSFIIVALSASAALAHRPHFKSKYDKTKNETQMTLNLILPKYQLVETGTWLSLKIDDANAQALDQQGAPNLLYISYYVSIPDNAKVKSVNIQPIREDVKLSKPIIPVLERYIVGTKPPQPVMDKKIYESLTMYPEKFYDFEITKQGTTRVLVFKFYPFHYIGKTQTLVVSRYAEANIVLETNSWKPNATPRNVVDKYLKDKLVNPKEAFFQGGAQ